MEKQEIVKFENGELLLEGKGRALIQISYLWGAMNYMFVALFCV